MILIHTLRVAHLAIISFIVTAWLIPSTWVRAAHLLFVPLMILHWKTNDNACVLTQMEQRWLARHRPDIAAQPKAQGDFTRRLLRPFLCGKEPTDNALLVLIYGVLWGGWALSAWGLWRDRGHAFAN